MAVTLSPRLKLPRWSSPQDPYRRTEQDDAHAKLDALAAMDRQGTVADQPAPAADNRGMFYTPTDGPNAGLTFRSDGTAWRGPFALKSAVDTGLTAVRDELAAAVTHPHVIVERAAALTVNPPAEVVVPFTAEVRDTHGLWAPADPNRITIPSAALAGLWQFDYVCAALFPSPGAADTGFIRLRHSRLTGLHRHPQNGTAVSNGGSASQAYLMEAGDSVDVTLYVTAAVTPSTHRLTAYRISSP